MLVISKFPWRRNPSRRSIQRARRIVILASRSTRTTLKLHKINRASQVEAKASTEMQVTDGTRIHSIKDITVTTHTTVKTGTTGEDRAGVTEIIGTTSVTVLGTPTQEVRMSRITAKGTQAAILTRTGMALTQTGITEG